MDCSLGLLWFGSSLLEGLESLVQPRPIGSVLMLIVTILGSGGVLYELCWPACDEDNVADGKMQHRRSSRAQGSNIYVLESSSDSC